MALAGGSPAGWYPDPAGVGQRYFDGSRWTNHCAPLARTRGKRAWKVGFAAVGAALIAAAAVWSATCSPWITESNNQRDVLRTCEDTIKKKLKDPDSAQFNDWTASKGGVPPDWMAYNPSAGDEPYVAHGTVNAKNSFGGYVGAEPWACDALVTSAVVRAEPHPIDPTDDGG